MTHPSEFTRNGLRAMTAEEGDALRVGDSVRILDSSLGVHHYGHVIGCRRDSVKVRFLISGAILPFDLDDPDLWADRELRDRRPPQVTEDETLFVLVTDKPQPVTLHDVMAWVALSEDTRTAIRAAFMKATSTPLLIETPDGYWQPTAECLQNRPTPDVFNALKASTELNEVLKQLSDMQNRLDAISEQIDALKAITTLKVEA